MIIALGQRLNIELVAEGVETEEQARYLRRHGVPVLQGFSMRGRCRYGTFRLAGGKRSPPARHNGHIVPLMPLR